MTKFKTKIVQRFVNGHEFYELLLPDGRCVASGSIDHCWDERERWEEILKTPQKCRECPHWQYTKTLGSPDVPEWHCRFGFSPSESCLEMAKYNINSIRDYYKRHPEELQLKLNF